MAHDVIHLAVTQDIDTGEVKVWKAPTGLWDYLKDATLIAAHNGISFDFPILNKLWKTKIGLKQAYDTLVVSRLLEPTREGGHSLDAWGKELGVQKLDYKATWQWMMNRREEYDGECFDAPIEQLLEFYCNRDVSVLVSLYTRLAGDVVSKGFSNDSIILGHREASITSKKKRKGMPRGTRRRTVLPVSAGRRRRVDAGEMQANGHDQQGHGVHWRTGGGLENTHRFNWREPGKAEFQQNQHDVHVSTISLCIRCRFEFKPATGVFRFWVFPRHRLA